MYILGGLLILRLFQCRHADVNVNAHTAYMSLAAVIVIALVGVVSSHARTVFCILRFTCVYI